MSIAGLSTAGKNSEVFDFGCVIPVLQNPMTQPGIPYFKIN